MLQQDQPDDFVISTGEQHSVREFVALAAGAPRLRDRMAGYRASTEEGVDRKTGKVAGEDRSALFPADRGRNAAR